MFSINKSLNPIGLKKDQYDVTIIGAGIGGLVCGCYLAKAGMKVLVIDKHDRPGGYCTSFRRNGFVFNAITSSLGNIGRAKGLGRIIDELSIKQKVKFIRADPAEIIRTPDFQIPIHNDVNRIIAEFQNKFPNSAKAIKDFFDFLILNDTVSLYAKLRNRTFADVLTQYFDDYKLKATIGMMLWRLGMKFSEMNAFTAAIHYREFIFDLGYHPEGGQQVLSDTLAERFKEAGGELLLSQSVNRIKIEDGRTCGLYLKVRSFIKSKFVVSACDPTHIFLDLIGENYLEKRFINQLRSFVPATSAFTVYLGINKSLKNLIPSTYLLCYYSNYKVDNYDPKDASHLEKKNLDILLQLIFPSFYDSLLAPEGKESISLTVLAPFKNKQYWRDRKVALSNKLIDKAKTIIPGISENIIVKNIVTPSTLYQYTLNRSGSVHGWACTPSQVSESLTPQISSIQNLFLAGQWVSLFTGESGLPTAAYTGRTAAKSILANYSGNLSSMVV